MTISEIYEQYQIMPNLQEHQLRVAAVAQQIAQSCGIEGEELHAIVTAGLLHDMGNIIKFKLDLFPEFLQPKGLKYWEKVKKEFVKKYGNDEHEATFQIVDELNVDKRAHELVHAIGFSKSVENLNQTDLSKKIVAYSDHRVAPFGVISLEARMREGRTRFKHNKSIPTSDKKRFEKQFQECSVALLEIEKQIFEQSSIKPEKVNNGSISNIVPLFLNFKIN